ncbi:hypothetical protein EVAR_99493_1 [Eumeta japonica]|uniref:Uncharacterized protein n=1 Tax=Eumeta variegata TaxID=151549 RepID=A0A4C1Z5K6_EUMVA|nr:hypothetical protein EVAR_99493_1 [Eumeta japonica]
MVEGVMHFHLYKPEHVWPNLSVRVQRPTGEEPQRKGEAAPTKDSMYIQDGVAGRAANCITFLIERQGEERVRFNL